MTPVARLVAQAKINLGLRVLAREESGYHSIETVYCRLALGDAVTVRVGDAGWTLRCDGPRCPAEGLGPAENNLAYRAAAAFAAEASWPRGCSIELRKEIPPGSGLGGGSADAGAVLRALNALAPEPVSESELTRIAGRLGSDVPFLATTSPMALAWSRGERMLAVPALPERHVAVVLPPTTVSTADAYAWLAATRSTYSPRARVLPAAALASWEALAPHTANDFEPVVVARHPEIARALAALRAAGATLARMTGSGSGVYGIFERGPDAAELSAEIGGDVVLTRTAPHVVPVGLSE